MPREIEIEWSDFGVAIFAELFDEENPELCEAFWQCLPFQTVFAASMSSGEMLKISVPVILPNTPHEKLVLLPEQPPGIIISLGMASLLLKYGTVVEPFRVPRLARVPREELDKLRDVTIKLRDAYFFTKEINIATLRRKRIIRR